MIKEIAMEAEVALKTEGVKSASKVAERGKSQKYFWERKKLYQSFMKEYLLLKLLRKQQSKLLQAQQPVELIIKEMAKKTEVILKRESVKSASKDAEQGNR